MRESLLAVMIATASWGATALAQQGSYAQQQPMAGSYYLQQPMAGSYYLQQPMAGSYQLQQPLIGSEKLEPLFNNDSYNIHQPFVGGYDLYPLRFDTLEELEDPEIPSGASPWWQ